MLQLTYPPLSKDFITLTEDQQQKLLLLLEKHSTLFDGTLGKWTGTAHKISLKEGATPYHARSFPIPKAYEVTLKDKVNRLVQVGVLKKVNHSEWAAPTFIILKKDKTVRFISETTMKQILLAKYSPANLPTIVKGYTHLSK